MHNENDNADVNKDARRELPVSEFTMLHRVPGVGGDICGTG